MFNSKQCHSKQCDPNSFHLKMDCSNKKCGDTDCRPFTVPKSYSDLMKDNKEHIETIKSLRELNKKLIGTQKEKDKDIGQKDKEICRLHALSNVYLKTYTNMSIELLKLEEKVAKFEGRGW